MPKPKLHRPHGKNRYCGPAAISAVTGVSTDEAAAITRVLTGKRSVKGMHDGEMVRALHALGCRVEEVGRTVRETQRSGKTRRLTLQEWLDRRGERERKGLMVVTVTGHFVAVKGDLVVDSLANREPRHILSDPSRNCVFRRAWLVTPPAKVKLPEELLIYQRAQKRERARAASDRTKALRLAKELGLGFERDGDYLYIQVEDTARWMLAMQPAGLLADGEEPIDAIADQCALMGLGWGETLGNLEEIKERFPV